MGEGGEAHVEADAGVGDESHGFVGGADVGEGGVEGVRVLYRVELVGVEGSGVDGFGGGEGDGVERVGVVGNEGGVGEFLSDSLEAHDGQGHN